MTASISTTQVPIISTRPLVPKIHSKMMPTLVVTSKEVIKTTTFFYY
uniref:Uncharacterized protein n=1 Tax=Arundo donax TaxID=35708 RepID=A0A0A9AR77_ARUDO